MGGRHSRWGLDDASPGEAGTVCRGVSTLAVETWGIHDVRALPIVLLRRRRPQTCHRYHHRAAHHSSLRPGSLWVLFASFTSIIGVVACMRYELRDHAPEDRPAGPLPPLCRGGRAAAVLRGRCPSLPARGRPRPAGCLHGWGGFCAELLELAHQTSGRLSRLPGSPVRLLQPANGGTLLTF